MTNSYSSTEVSISRSQEAIRKLLMNFGAKGVQIFEDFETRQINVRFAKDVNGQLRTVSVTMVVPEAEPPKGKSSVRHYRGKIIRKKSLAEKQEQNAKATFRALHYWLKSQFEAVEYGLFSFEDVFLSHFEWIINGETTTIGALVKPKLEGKLLTVSQDETIIEAE